MTPTSNAAIEAILKEFPLFAQLAAEHLAELARAARSSTFEADQAIYRAGDPIREMYILLSGQVKLALSCNRGTELIIDLVDAGRSFGEAELFGGAPYLAEAVATKQSRVLSIARESLHQVMNIDPRIALRAMKLLAQRQIELEAELATWKSCSGRQRVLEFILKLAGPQRDPATETLLTLGISKQMLAARCGMQPETLSRTLRDLTETGLIAVDGRRISLKHSVIEPYLANEAAAQSSANPGGARRRRTSGYVQAVTTAAAPVRNSPGEPRSLCDSINQAGRQRMLSQRMAKSWLMLERGVLSRRSRVILRQSMAMFDATMRDFERLPGRAAIHPALTDLTELWRPYQALLHAEPSRKAARDLFRINEDVLESADRLTLALERADGSHKAHLVNLAGRQRMLSQRMAKFFMFRHMGIQSPKCRMKLEEANAEFATALTEFSVVTEDKPEIAAELARVAEYWNTLQSALVERKVADFATAAAKVFTTSENLLRHMDSAVELYVERPVSGIAQH